MSDLISRQQPVARDTNVLSNDTVSRQAAIDAMCAACWDWCDEGVCKRVSALQQLPPTQPEIIRCKDCKYWISHDKRCVYLNHGFAPNMWCCHGERRTDE